MNALDRLWAAHACLREAGAADCRKAILDLVELVLCVERLLPDLEHYVATYGEGPDRRFDSLQTALKQVTGKSIAGPTKEALLIVLEEVQVVLDPENHFLGDKEKCDVFDSVCDALLKAKGEA